MSPIADRSIVLRIGGNVTGLLTSLKTAKQATQDWGNQALSYVDKNEQHINTLARGFGIAGAALTGFAVLAVKSFADFDASMSSVQAATMESADNMALLRDAAIDAGARTVYSATEASGAIEELAKAGVSTADILSGGLDGALDLAASGAIGVGEAAEIAATAMTQFGLGGDQVSHIADLLAAGAGKAQGGVSDLGMALKQAGLVADQTGLTIEETTAGLTAFASAGLIGSDAGTSFKAMLQRLTPQSQESEKLMDQLGISAYDAQGNFIGLANFAQNLQESLRDLTPEQRNSAMATIFGSDAVRAANVIYEQGAEGIQQWTAAVDDQGYAAAQAAIRMDNLKGDIEGLSGSVETALIGIGEGADGMLRYLTQAADGAVDSFNDMSDGAKQATLLIAGAGGLTLLGIAGLGKLAVAVSNTKTALQAMGITAKTASLSVGAIGGVLAIATVALSGWANESAKSKARVDALADSFDDVTGAITEMSRSTVADSLLSGSGWGIFRNEMDTAANNAEKLGLSLDTVTDAILGNEDAMTQVTARLQEAQAAYEGLGSDEINTQVADQKYAADQLANAIGNLNGEYQDAAEQDRQRRAAIGESTDATDDATSSVQQLTEAEQAAADATEAASEALADWIKTTADADASFFNLQGAYDTIIQKNKDVAQATADSTGDAKKSWEDYYDGVTFSLDEYLGELDRQVAAQQNWESNLIALTGRASQGVIEHLRDLGPDGAPLVQALVDGTQEQMDRFEASLDQGSIDGPQIFADNLQQAISTGLIAKAAAELGQDAANQIVQKLADGVTTVPDVMAEYGLEIEKNPLDVPLNTELTLEQLSGLLGVINSSSGFLHIEGDDGPLQKTLNEATAQVNDSDGTVTIYGDDGSAITTLSNYTSQVDQSRGTVTISGTDSEGRQTTAVLTQWIGEQGASVKVDADTSDADRSVEAYVQRVSSRVATVGVAQKMASGGPVTGGIAGRDSVHALLMPGEHVLTASDVTKLGGQAAVYGLRSAIQSGRGLPGYASGGAVAPSVQYIAPSSTVVPTVSVTAPELPDLYIQNPFTGEWARAQVASIARTEALSVAGTQRGSRPRS